MRQGIVSVKKQLVAREGDKSPSLPRWSPAIVVKPARKRGLRHMRLDSSGLPDRADQPALLGELAFPARHDFSLEHAVKRLGDIVGALLLAVLFSPIILVVLISSLLRGRAVLFRHQRVGRDGRLFWCLKFQTMVPNAEDVLRRLLATDPALRAEWESDHKLRNDPRVTRAGRFLRSTSLDELPQLWNVIKGEMSLVGPRPVTREELLRYGRNSLIYTMVRPGITGLWQVSGRNNAEYRRRVAMDVCYVKRQSAVLDLWILAKTVIVVVTGHGAY
jgi:lipopolysaccharide/colanic/teichoic acid biosynthesis glycosyltransferase